MPLPEGYLPRKGDVLVLHGVVKYDVVRELADYDEDQKLVVWVRLLGDFQDRRVTLDTVVGVAVRNWEAGEKVRLCRAPSVTAEVVSMTDDVVLARLIGFPADHPVRGLQLFRSDEVEPLPSLTEKFQPSPQEKDAAQAFFDSIPSPEKVLITSMPATPKIVDAPIKGPNDPGYAVRDSSEDPDHVLHEEVQHQLRATVAQPHGFVCDQGHDGCAKERGGRCTRPTEQPPSPRPLNYGEEHARSVAFQEAGDPGRSAEADEEEPL